MLERTIARRYTKALIESSGKDSMPVLERDFSFAETIWNASDVVRAWFLNPSMKKDVRENVMERFLKLAAFSGKAQTFFRLLAKRNRISLLPHIIQVFRELSDEIQNRIRVELISSEACSPSAVDSIKRALENKLGKSVLLNVGQKGSLLGGIILKYKGTVIDGSLKMRLDRLKELLKEE
ncbi:MAG TPA: ATP synthase F1 subunit delta [bacterium]